MCCRPDGSQRMVREMARGEVIGEIAMYTDEARSASVVAIRDSVLVRLDKAPFRRLIALSSQVSLALMRQIVRRVLLQIEAARLRHITLARSISASTNSTTRPQVRHTRWS